MDLDGEELSLSLRIGGWPAVVSALGVLLLLTGVFLGRTGIWIPNHELRPVELASHHRGDELRSIASGSFMDYARCRIPLLTDDVMAHPGSLAQGSADARTRSLLDEALAAPDSMCRPTTWVGPGSELDRLPTHLVAGAPVANPLWDHGARVSTGALAAAEMRQHDRLQQEFELIRRIPNVAEGPPVEGEDIRARAMDLVWVLGGLFAAMFGLAMMLAGVSWPRFERVRIGSRGVELGERRWSASEIASLEVVGSRLVVTLRSGEVVRSGRIRDTTALESLVTAFGTLAPAEAPPAAPETLEALTRESRREGSGVRFEQLAP